MHSVLDPRSSLLFTSEKSRPFHITTDGPRRARSQRWAPKCPGSYVWACKYFNYLLSYSRPYCGPTINCCERSLIRDGSPSDPALREVSGVRTLIGITRRTKQERTFDFQQSWCRRPRRMILGQDPLPLSFHTDITTRNSRQIPTLVPQFPARSP